MSENAFIQHLKEVGVIVAIAILLPLTIHYGSTLLSPYPTGRGSSDENIWIHGKNYSRAEIIEMIAKKNGRSTKELKQFQTALQQANIYHEQLNQYKKTLFYTCLILGILSILLGLILTIHAIDVGLIFGGTFSLIDGYSTYWDSLPNTLQFLSLMIALFLVIMTAYIKMVRVRC